MSVSIPPLPQYVFMAWSLVKAQGQLYLYLLLLPTGINSYNFKERLSTYKEINITGAPYFFGS
jgi:hypothetical protein